MSTPSRTPAPAYDQSLLAAAPEATRAAKQEGYNVDLLDAGRQRSTQSRSVDIEAARYKETQNLSGGTTSLQNIPFWRTRTGIIGIVVLVVVIIGAVVGGAVGGSVSHHAKNGTLPLGSSHSSTNTTSGQAVATQQVKGSSTNPDSAKESSTSTVPANGPLQIPTITPTNPVVQPTPI